MRKQERKHRKKIGDRTPLASQHEQADAKVFSHQVMQMQSLYGNKAVERTINQINKKNNNMTDETESVTNFIEPKLIPIQRSWNKDDVLGMRMYLTREQFHYNPRSERSEKKMAETDAKFGQKKEIDDAASGDSSVVTPQHIQKEKKKDANFTLASQSKGKEKNEEAKRYFTSQTTGDLDDVKTSPSITEEENLDSKIEKMIKYGRFSFIGAYPSMLLAVRRRKKKEGKDMKEKRKKSTFSRLKKRFSNKR